MIRFDNVTKTYRGNSNPGLQSVDFEVLRGEFVFLVGPSGSGKSTCLRLILREDVPSKGGVVVLGRDTRSLTNRKVPFFRRHIGAVFQDFRLLPNKTVFQNVAFALQVTGSSRGYIRQTVPEALALVGLDDKQKRMPHELSGGEQQRVAIARAIVNRPQVLLADEPTGNLDPGTSIGIMKLLSRINAGGTTVVMATHEAGLVDQMRRRVIELDDGSVIRDEAGGGYGDTTSLPTLEPVKQRGTEAMAAFMAVRTVQETLAARSDADLSEDAVRAAVGTRATDAEAAAAPDEAESPSHGVAPPREGEGEDGSAPMKRNLTGPIEIELPELPEVGVADRLGLTDDGDESVGPTS